MTSLQTLNVYIFFCGKVLNKEHRTTPTNILTFGFPDKFVELINCLLVTFVMHRAGLPK